MIQITDLLKHGQKIIDNGVTFAGLRNFIEKELAKDGKKHYIVDCESSTDGTKCSEGVVLYIDEYPKSGAQMPQRMVCHLEGDSYTVLIHNKKNK